MYSCEGAEFDPAHANQGAECDDAIISVQVCRGGTIIGAWAVGGEVSCKYKAQANCVANKASMDLFIDYNHAYIPKENTILIYTHLFHVLLQDFVYPEGVALPLGGAGNSEYVVLEIHYDNPNLVAGEEHSLNKPQ